MEICSGTYMLSEGKICCKEGSDGSYVFPIIIEEIRLLRVNIFLETIVICCVWLVSRIEKIVIKKIEKYFIKETETKLKIK